MTAGVICDIKGFITVIAFGQFCTTIYSFTYLTFTLIWKVFTTLLTFTGFLFHMCSLIYFKITVLWKWFIIPIIFLGIVSSNIFFLSGDRKHFTILNNFIVFLSSMNGFMSLPHGLHSLFLSRMCSFIPRRPYYSMGLPHWLHSQQYIFFNVFRENSVVKRLCHFYYTCGISLLYLFFSTLRDNCVLQKAHFFCLYGFSLV